jgi:hypothetical protein
VKPGDVPGIGDGHCRIAAPDGDSRLPVPLQRRQAAKGQNAQVPT